MKSMKILLAVLLACAAFSASAKEGDACSITGGSLILTQVDFAQDGSGDTLAHSGKTKLRFAWDLPIASPAGPATITAGERVKFTTDIQDDKGYCRVVQAEVLENSTERTPFNPLKYTRARLRASHAADCGPYQMLGQRPVCIK